MGTKNGAVKILVEVEEVHGEVREIDTDIDDGDRITLTIIRGGALSVQAFRESGCTAKPFYQLAGAVILPGEFVRDWAETLFKRTRYQDAHSCPHYPAKRRSQIKSRLKDQRLDSVAPPQVAKI